MNLTDRIELIKMVGEYFGDIVKLSHSANSNAEIQEDFQLVQSHQKYNGWFTTENIIHALDAWHRQLTSDNISKWASELPLESPQKTIGIVMAGNLPLVGFHDFLCVFITGNKAKIKLSGQDNLLFPVLINYLNTKNRQFEPYVELVDKITEVDAVIATGSNNTSRYFEQYFGNMPNIIRKNRTSVAVLDGTESEQEMLGLADDLLLYFGLGCRNVSKLYLPENFDLNKIFGAVFETYAEVINHNKYANNYDYHKAIYMLNSISILENGLIILKEDSSIHSPVSVVNYEYYKNLDDVRGDLKKIKDQIQCVVSKQGIWDEEVAFGKTQNPALWNYADNVNTLEFLQKIQ